MRYLLSSQTHLDGVSERKGSMWKSEFLPGWLTMETEALFQERTAERSETSVPLQDLGPQKQQPCWFSSALHTFTACSRGDVYSSLHLLTRHCFQCYSHLRAHHFLWDTDMDTKKIIPADSLCSRDQIKSQGKSSFYYNFSKNFPVFWRSKPPCILSQSWVNVFSKSETDESVLARSLCSPKYWLVAGNNSWCLPKISLPLFNKGGRCVSLIWNHGYDHWCETVGMIIDVKPWVL